MKAFLHLREMAKGHGVTGELIITVDGWMLKGSQNTRQIKKKSLWGKHTEGLESLNNLGQEGLKMQNTDQKWVFIFCFLVLYFYLYISSRQFLCVALTILELTIDQTGLTLKDPPPFRYWNYQYHHHYLAFLKTNNGDLLHKFHWSCTHYLAMANKNSW